MRCAVALLAWATFAVLAQADELNERVRRLAADGDQQVRDWRRDFHAHPELGNREQRTGQTVVEALRQMGITEIRPGVAGHGVVALIRGRQAEPVVGLRADMDALAITEQTGLPFASQNAGVMHACGHDVHLAVLLGTARILQSVRGELPGSVKLIFQPAEEGVPAGEKGGAPEMIAQGVLDNPAVSAIFALHVSPELPAGELGVRPGAIMAAVDRFRLTVRGKQSHAAMPWQGVDPIVASAHIVTALQTIVARHVDARQPVVVSISTIHAGTAWNILPGEARMEGTVRTHDEATRRKVGEWFQQVVSQTAAAHGVTAELEFTNYGPATWNDPALTARMKPTLAAAARGKLIDVEASMGGEDFAHYARRVPGVYFFLGVATAGGAPQRLHNPQLIIDESALPLGVEAMARMAIDYLCGPSK